MRDAVAALPGVGLADLVEAAELLARVDRKYVVAIDELPVLLAATPPGTRVLQIDDRRTFAYRSTYLDTPDLDSFLTSGRSHRRRWKVRSRAYLDTGGSWLEVKTAGARGQTIKRRLPMAPQELEGLTPDGSGLVTGIVGAGVADRLRPTLHTTYRRTTLLLPCSARVTLDVDLAWASARTSRTLSRPGLAIVETKTGSTPSSFDRSLWALGHRPVRISKYGAGMAALHPDLPRLKWHRALERHLDIARPDRQPTTTPTDHLVHQQRSNP